jgi:hypothetical protein
VLIELSDTLHYKFFMKIHLDIVEFFMCTDGQTRSDIHMQSAGFRKFLKYLYHLIPVYLDILTLESN